MTYVERSRFFCESHHRVYVLGKQSKGEEEGVVGESYPNVTRRVLISVHIGYNVGMLGGLHHLDLHQQVRLVPFIHAHLFNCDLE